MTPKAALTSRETDLDSKAWRQLPRDKLVDMAPSMRFGVVLVELYLNGRRECFLGRKNVDGSGCLFKLGDAADVILEVGKLLGAVHLIMVLNHPVILMNPGVESQDAVRQRVCSGSRNGGAEDI